MEAWDNVPFPKHIDFNRPHDGIGVVLDIEKMDINKGVSDDKFVLTQPEGTKLQIVGQAPRTGASDRQDRSRKSQASSDTAACSARC